MRGATAAAIACATAFVVAIGCADDSARTSDTDPSDTEGALTGTSVGSTIGATIGSTIGATVGTEGDTADSGTASADDTTGCVPRQFHPDGDGDGWGDPARTTLACAGEAPRGWVDVSDDCDDTEALRNPGQDELCGDGLDNDCDDKQDEWSPSNAVCDGCWLAGASLAHAVCLVQQQRPSLEQATARCTAFGSDLASVHGGEENDRIVALLAEAGVADATIGFVFDARRGQWGWADGSAVDFEAWGRGHPRSADAGQDCAAVMTDGTWRPVTCEGVAAPTAVVCRDANP